MPAGPARAAGLLLLLAALTHARDLSRAGHQAAIDNVGATFSLVGSAGDDCPKTVAHALAAGKLPHAGVVVEGAKCTSGGAAAVFRSDVFGDLDRASAAIGTGFVNGLELATTVFANSPGAVVAVETTERQCGKFSFGKGTVSAFILTETPVTISPGRQVPNGFWLVISSPNRVGLCVYSGPGQTRRNGSGGTTGGPGSTGGAGSTGGTESSGNNPAGANASGSGGSSVTIIPPSSGTSTAGKEPRSTDAAAGEERIVFKYQDDSCFPGSALVELEGGSVKPMRELSVGDRVKVGPGIYSPVFMFTHRVARAQGPFLRLRTSEGTSITLTAGHFLHVNGEMRAASDVRIGDLLLNGLGIAVQVRKIDIVIRDGLYNPQTVHGDIVVNGVQATSYTAALNPQVAHSLLAPFRAAFQWTGANTDMLEDGMHAPPPVGLVGAKCST